MKKTLRKTQKTEEVEDRRYQCHLRINLEEIWSSTALKDTK